MPGQILTGSFDYDSVRNALGVEKDQARFVTDRVIESWMFLPRAEAEAINRYGLGSIAVYLARDPFDPGLAALKAGVCALTCAFLCQRMETTIPLEIALENGQKVTRNKIDWLAKRQLFISDANWAFSISGLDSGGFPRAMDHASGNLSKSDPLFHPDLGAQFIGYTSPLSGYMYAFTINA